MGERENIKKKRVCWLQTTRLLLTRAIPAKKDVATHLTI